MSNLNRKIMTRFIAISCLIEMAISGLVCWILVWFFFLSPFKNDPIVMATWLVLTIVVLQKMQHNFFNARKSVIETETLLEKTEQTKEMLDKLFSNPSQGPL